MIGRKGVDPVSGEMSPVIGARLNQESRLVVPKTQASSSHRKPKPPPGAVGMLEEEIVARRGYWRRQRQKEQEVNMENLKCSTDLSKLHCKYSRHYTIKFRPLY